MTPLQPDLLTDVAGEIYGIRLRGLLPAGFLPYLRRPGRVAGSTTELAVTYETIHEPPTVEPIWRLEPGPEVAAGMALFRQPGGFGLSIDGDGQGLFRVSSEEIAIEWLPGGVDAARCFFSYALPLWLELTGVPVLHASAVSLGDRAVAFIGPSGVGKSTLCAGLLRTGCHFLADDGLPLFEDEAGGWRCASGPPWLGLWPSALERCLDMAVEDLPRVRDSLEKRMLSCRSQVADKGPARPQLGAVYLLEGQAAERAEVAITACSARDSLLHLIEHSLAGGPVAVLGWSARRLRALSRLAKRAPVRRLRYPVGDTAWQRVRWAIESDLAGAASPSRRN